MKLKWIILAVVALILAGLIGLPFYAHYRLKSRVANYRAELRKRGEKTTIAEAVPPAPTNGPNGAMQFVTAAGQLQTEGFFISDVSPMRGIPPGRARVAWQQETLILNKTSLWPLVTKALASNQVALADLRSALSNPVVRFNIDYYAGFNARLPHLAPMKNAAQWLSTAAVFDLREGRVERAHENLMALMASSQTLAEERFLICHLVRIAATQISVGAFWEALQHPGFNDTHLAAWQKAWEQTDVLKQSEHGAQMEGAMVEQIFKEARKNPTMLANPFGPAPAPNNAQELKDTLSLHVLWPHWFSYEDEYRSLRQWQGTIEAARMARTNQNWSGVIAHLEAIRDQIKKECPSPSLINDFINDDETGRNFLSKSANLETARRLLVTAIALQRYKLRHGKFPEKLAALVPEFLPAQPRDFMDGQPLRYRLNADGTYLLYSVGEDGKDDGGDGTIPDSKTVRNWLKGRDWVWPRPATKEEIEADNSKPAK